MVSVRLDEAIENQLNYLSKERKTPKSQIIKDSLIMYFQKLKEDSKEKSPYELGSELFGKYSSGDEDLSSTYKQKIKEKLNAKNSHR